jgi:hypothetical protein
MKKVIRSTTESLTVAYQSNNIPVMKEAIELAFSSGEIGKLLNSVNIAITTIIRMGAKVAINHNGNFASHDYYEWFSLVATQLANCEAVNQKVLQSYIKELGFNIKVESNNETIKNVRGKPYKKLVYDFTITRNKSKESLLNKDFFVWESELLNVLEYQDFLNNRNHKDSQNPFEIDFSQWKKSALNKAAIAYIKGLVTIEELRLQFIERDVTEIIGVLSKDKKLIESANTKHLTIDQIIEQQELVLLEHLEAEQPV